MDKQELDFLENLLHETRERYEFAEDQEMLDFINGILKKLGRPPIP